MRFSSMNTALHVHYPLTGAVHRLPHVTLVGQQPAVRRQMNSDHTVLSSVARWCMQPTLWVLEHNRSITIHFFTMFYILKKVSVMLKVAQLRDKPAAEYVRVTMLVQSRKHFTHTSIWHHLHLNSDPQNSSHHFTALSTDLHTLEPSC
jgi:hypothetical protein